MENKKTTRNSLNLLVEELHSALQGDTFWEHYFGQPLQSGEPFSLHLAIFVEPYLQFILEGKKTVESRFSTRRFAPYKRVNRGDIVLLKRSSGPIVGICQVSHVWFYQLDPQSWQSIREDFTTSLCAQDPKFWQDRESASFATLMRIENVKAIEPIKFVKRDRRGWVILYENLGQLQLNLGDI